MMTTHDELHDNPNVIYGESICNLIATTLLEEDTLVINADW